MNKEETPILKLQLKKMQFLVSNNPYQLIDDVDCVIIGDSIVECWIRHLLPNKELVANFCYEGSEVRINNMPAQSGFTATDYSRPVKISVVGVEQCKDYIVYVHTFTGLPLVWIETEGRKAIASKINYINASFKLEENVTTRSAGDVIEANVQIKGRGTSSWVLSPKKSYRLKFENKISIFDWPKDKSWCMIANHFDRSMIRNYIAYYIGKQSNLDYTPNFRFVELVLNGRYNGTYMLGDKLKISKDRVNIGDDGFLIEIDQRVKDEGDPFFETKHLEQPINIHEPEVVVGDDNYNYIKEYVIKAEDALFSDNFMDENHGWRKYMDIKSFVDWYIIHEIARNYDALCLYTSCYLNKKRDGKLKMGPIWDFDVTFGNNENPFLAPVEGLIGDNSSWFSRLFEDPSFKKEVALRYNYFYSLKDSILKEIDSNARYLKYSIEENNNKWGVLYNEGFINQSIWGCYENEVQYLKDWIVKRMDWLRDEFQNYN